MSSKASFIALLTAAAALSLLMGCGGGGGSQDTDGFQAQLVKKLERSRVPDTYTDGMREYAIEQLDSITDHEMDALAEPPVIRHNYDGTEYAFMWKVQTRDGGCYYIEVLSTPPQCIPLGAYRVKRPYYP
jgi:hypothetical protein